MTQQVPRKGKAGLLGKECCQEHEHKQECDSDGPTVEFDNGRMLLVGANKASEFQNRDRNSDYCCDPKERIEPITNRIPLALLVDPNSHLQPAHESFKSLAMIVLREDHEVRQEVVLNLPAGLTHFTT